jgi:hypothetical protein
MDDLKFYAQIEPELLPIFVKLFDYEDSMF